MASVIKIKNSTGSVPPTGLTFGEPAFVQGTGLTANRLYMGNSTSTSVWVGAEISTTGTWTDNAAKTTLATQYATDQRIASQISGSGVSSFNGATGAVTGVSSFNGLTGAVGGVTTSVANTFTALQTFSAGISASGGTFSGDIRTTQSTASIFNTTATILNIGGAATTMTLGATSGGAVIIQNPTLTLGNTTSSIETNASDTNHLTIEPFGNIVLAPIRDTVVGGDYTVVTITNSDQGVGQVQIEGGDLHLGNKLSNIGITSSVSIIFDGTITDANKTYLTVTNPTAIRTITLPDATGTVALTATSVASFNGLTGAVQGVSAAVGSTYLTVSGSTGSVTFTNTGVQTFNGLTGAVTGLTSGGPLGTPSTGTLTNCTGLPVATGISGLCGGIATFLAQSTSANLATAISDETGSGSLVFATNPTLSGVTLGAATATTINKVTITKPLSNATITIDDNLTFAVSGQNVSLTGSGVGSSVTVPATGTLSTLAGAETLSNKTLSGVTLGTPASGTLTNCTSLPVATGISGLCGGIAAFLAQPTSANLATAMSNETGTGLLVFATDPVLTTPNIGAATGTSLVLSAGLSANGGTFGTPTQLVGTNITGTATGFTVGSASLATNSLSLGGTAASGWAQLASPTFTGTVNTSNLIVGGDLTVSGTTTTINSTTLTINDFNIIVGATLSGTGATGAAIATGAGIAVGTGTGISFAYQHSSTSWLSTVDLNILTGKTYKIAGAEVLSSTTLGTSVVTSSLTSVGTLTTFVIDAGTF